MWLHPNLQTIIQDADQYTARNGTTYPGNWPKAQIAELLPVTVVAPGNTQFQDAVANGVVWNVDHWQQAWTITNWVQARIDAFNAAAAQSTADTSDLSTAKLNAAAVFLLSNTPATISAYVQTNVTTLAQAKNVLADLAVMVSILGKPMLR
jgi:hypothetical protein